MLFGFRLKSFEPAGAPIADLKYDPTSTALAYAVSYDWSKASQEYSPLSESELSEHVNAVVTVQDITAQKTDCAEFFL